MKYKKCFKCGKTKLAIIERTDPRPVPELEMTMMGYGQHKDQFKCKNCNE